MKKTLITAFVCACLLLAAAGRAAAACSCLGHSSPADAYASASAAFLGVVVAAGPARSRAGEAGEQAARVRVEEPFKGARRAGAEVVFRQPGHSCAPKFKAGDRWLFYATFREKSRTWEVRGCGRSGPADRSPDDLLFLRALPASARRTRISGVLKHYEDGPGGAYTPAGQVAGAKVKIAGAGKTYEVLTNADGVYELYDLPPGRYAIEPEVPAGLRINFARPFGRADSGSRGALVVELPAAGGAGADYFLGAERPTGRR